MSTVFFTAQAPGRAQVTKVTPALVEIGDVFTLTIGRKPIAVTATAATVANVVSLFVLAIGDFSNTFPEWAEVSASTGTDGSGATTHLILTGKDDGTPFTVTSSVATLASSVFAITVVELQRGSVAANQKQRITLPGPPTAGNFTLTHAGATTGNIAYNASAATVETAFELLATVGAGNGTVSLNGTGDWTVEFTGTLAGTRQPLISGTNVSLTGACSVSVAVVQQGRPASYAKGPTYSLTLTPPVDSFRFKVTPPSATYDAVDYFSDFVSNSTGGATADDVRKALESILVPVAFSLLTDLVSEPGPGTVPAYTLIDVIGPAGGPFNIVMRDGNTIAMTTDSVLTIDTVYTTPGVEGGTDVVVLALVSAASTAAINEIQHVAINGGPTGGTFTLTFQGQTTAGIAYNATNYAVREALCALSNIAGTSEVQTIGFTGGPPTGGTFKVNFAYGGSVDSTPIDWNATAGAVQTILEAMSNIGVGNVVCTGGPFNTTAITVTFQNALGRLQLPQLSQALNSLTPATPLAFATTTDGVDSDVTVSGSGTRYSPFLITFVSTYAGTNVQPMTASGTSLTGATPAIEIIQDVIPGVNERQEIVITGGVPAGGTFTLNPGAGNTGAIAYNATAATVLAALGAVTAVTDFNVTGGPFPTVPMVVEFKGTTAAMDISLMTGVASSLSSNNTQTLTVLSPNLIEPTGPHHWDDPNNWNTGAVPSAADIVYVQNIETDISYGLAGITGTLTELHFMASFTGKFGLLPTNPAGYYEYRTTSGTLKATLVLIGEGVGSGSPYISINASTVQTQLLVYATGDPEDLSVPALNWKGTHASNVVRIFKGSFGCALLVGEVATIVTLQIGYVGDREGDVQFTIGSGVTLSTVSMSGGNGEIAGLGINILTVTGGVLVLTGTGIVNNLYLRPGEGADATVVYNTTGTLTNTFLGGTGKLDFSQDMRTKTIANPILVYSQEASVHDPFGVANAAGTLYQDFVYLAGVVNSSNLGTNVRIGRTNL